LDTVKVPTLIVCGGERLGGRPLGQVGYRLGDLLHRPGGGVAHHRGHQPLVGLDGHRHLGRPRRDEVVVFSATVEMGMIIFPRSLWPE